MTRQEFAKLINSRIVFVDGATGSNLQKLGRPSNVCPETWILENPEVLIGLQEEFLEAGSDILFVPSFTANRIKLQEYGQQERIKEINQGLVKLSRQAVQKYREKTDNQRPIYVAGNLTMTGEQLQPMGKLAFEELVDIYKEQLSYLLEEGVDLIVVETMMSLQECRAAVLAVKESCELPLIVSLTFEENGRTLYGTAPKTAVIVLQSMGVDAIGVNCSTGPDKMLSIIKEMKPYANIPIMAKPNAGIPQLIDGKTVFPMKEDEFATEMLKLVEAGANIAGGCCGSTPGHIAQMVRLLKEATPILPKQSRVRALTTEQETLEIPLDGQFLVVGERINPTGKKALQQELMDGKLDMVLAMAEEQKELGASILDINIGMSKINEKETMLQVIQEVLPLAKLPLAIDTSNIEVMEAALRIYPGRALINSISLEKEKYEKLIPIAKKYGAMFILLPLSDKGLPKSIEEKKQIIQTVMERAFQLGLTKEDIIVDGLVNTVGANKNAAIEAIETIRYCKEELGVATIVGLSNISFGLPERQYINSTFLAFAMQAGLTMAIANPSQDLLMNTALAADLLCGVEGAAEKYIERVTERPTTITTQTKGETPSADSSAEALVKVAEPADARTEVKKHIFDGVVKGNRKGIIALVEKGLEQGLTPDGIIEEALIPAINEVGRLYESQRYFLPQLISGAEAMKLAIDYLEPMLKKDEKGSRKGTIVIATVAGDIHDIGKNLVALMLKNYGFHVIDLGKDVPTEKILDTAEREKADIIALSALMTTTMVEMKKVVEAAKERGLKCKIIIGGAVITDSYAVEIGADGYSEDAQSAVSLVNKILNL